MKIWMSWENEAISEAEQEHQKQWFEKAVAVTMEEEGVNLPVEISITVTTAEEVHRINQEFRGIDRTTDVLSFPMIEYTSENFLDDIENGEWNPDTECVVLGDVILNYEQAVRQAEEYGHSTDREMVFLVIHSLLHLLGYDHMVEEEEALMRERQRHIMEVLNLPR